MSRQRILVTGAGGFVGSHLGRRIAESGAEALGIGRDLPAPAPGEVFTATWNADILDPVALEAAIAEARPTAIVHLAAQSSGAAAFEHPVETYRVNALGTLTLLEAVRRAAPGARVLVVGTGEIYGPQPDGSRVSEDAPLRPVSPYGLSKAAADTMAETCARLWRLDVVRTRSFGHIGPGQTDRFMVPSLARQIAEIEIGLREPVLRVGNLDVTRDLTDVRDVVEAYLALLARGRAGSAYNVCRGVGTHLTEVTRWWTERARVPVRIEVDPTRVRPVDLGYLVGDPSAIARDTGWKATVSLDRTLGEVLDEWREKTSLDSRREGD